MCKEWQVLCGDCREILRNYPDNYFDSVVADPPYGLSKQPNIVEVLTHWLAGDDYKQSGGGFMGKSWDSFVPGPATWKEVYRVLKPGGHLLAFGGTRTVDLLTIAIRLAGFEVRDCIGWVHGQGFPKSLDISKAIDKMDASEEQKNRRLLFTKWVRSHGVTSAQIDAATNSNMGGHYTTSKSQPAIMTREHLELCRSLFPEIPEWVERECNIRSVESRNMAEREVVGQVTKGSSPLPGNHAGTWSDGQQDGTYNVTTPSTDAAKQWDGWGTALKPAIEPIVLCRKPLSEATVAENVLRWGTGGINVGGCRVPHNEPIRPMNKQSGGNKVYKQAGRYGETTELKESGRWPPNITHDGSAEVAGLFPSSSAVGYRSNSSTNKTTWFGAQDGSHIEGERGYKDSGSASRFYPAFPLDPTDYPPIMYCPKASKRDRDEGLDGFEETDRKGESIWAGECPICGCRMMMYGKPTCGHGKVNWKQGKPRRNHHSTVKPTSLMRWLVRLVTPPNGLVLDPFCGSGTTGKACILEGFSFMGIDLEEEYCEIARARIAHAASMKIQGAS